MKLPKVKPAKMSAKDLINHLKLVGYKRIGSGQFSIALSVPKTNTVCKIGFYDDLHEDAYLRFLSGINQKNPLFPRIQSIKIYDGEQIGCDNYYVVVMEKLTKYTKVRAAARKQGLNKYNLTSIHNLERWPIVYARESCENKAFQAATKMLIELYRFHEEDIHDGNVMWRHPSAKVPQLVITDPVW